MVEDVVGPVGYSDIPPNVSVLCCICPFPLLYMMHECL